MSGVYLAEQPADTQTRQCDRPCRMSAPEGSICADNARGTNPVHGATDRRLGARIADVRMVAFRNPCAPVKTDSP
jgi:hypothetical protein